MSPGEEAGLPRREPQACVTWALSAHDHDSRAGLGHQTQLRPGPRGWGPLRTDPEGAPALSVQPALGALGIWLGQTVPKGTGGDPRSSFLLALVNPQISQLQAETPQCAWHSVS